MLLVENVKGVARHEPLPQPAGGGAFERTSGERDIERPDPDQSDDDGFVGRCAPDQPTGDEFGHLPVDPVLSKTARLDQRRDVAALRAAFAMVDEDAPRPSRRAPD